METLVMTLYFEDIELFSIFLFWFRYLPGIGKGDAIAKKFKETLVMKLHEIVKTKRKKVFHFLFRDYP